jgi:hypothetical protein
VIQTRRLGDAAAALANLAALDRARLDAERGALADALKNEAETMLASGSARNGGAR